MCQHYAGLGGYHTVPCLHGAHSQQGEADIETECPCDEDDEEAQGTVRAALEFQGGCPEEETSE